MLLQVSALSCTATDGIIQFLERSGLRVETRDKENPKLTAFRRNIHFPELLFDLRLSGHKDERLLIKVESQDQGINYIPVVVDIKGCGFFFPFPVPSDGVLCSMKIAAMLSRAKGRDFYDLMFLLSQAKPDYDFLSRRCRISNLKEFKEATAKLLETVDLNKKQKDFEHLLFNKTNSGRILRFGDYAVEVEVYAYILERDYGLYLAAQEALILDVLDTLDRTGGALALPSQTTIVTQDSWVNPEKAAAAKKAMESGGSSTAPDGGSISEGSRGSR